MDKYLYKPYKPCKGRKYRKLPKMYRPLANRKGASICNSMITDKNKLRFITQIFRWFKKDNKNYKMDYFFREQYGISECDLLFLSCKTQKAAWKKLLLKLDYTFSDYKKIKRRSFSLSFVFFFVDLQKKTKDLTIDVKANKLDSYFIFITLNSFFLNDIFFIINTLSDNNFVFK
jgi:hypothetical protein